MMTDNYLCIHGHFYQPPRENPWSNAIEYQPTARPYHDWNERITRECYAPNSRARLHGDGDLILRLINNYEYMSFNFGPTLLSWLEKANPWLYAQILAADRESQDRYQGHGNALAQVYNHIIMPLARRRDKMTQIRWGLADFKHRFRRRAEGMWLAETAVDTETLDIMAQEGVKFTILSPAQAQSVRPLGERQGAGSWKDVSGGHIDPTRPYRVLLEKSGHRFIDVFFYEATLSRAVAYEKILASGENLLARIEGVFAKRQDGPRLVSVATDGESYGHHFKFGDLALAWLFNHLEQTEEIRLTNYGSFLEHFPPENEVKLIENSSWSCAHGIERWRTDCGCNVSHTEGWNQAWRGPLREGLEWLAGELASLYEERGGRLVKDPWKARDDYIRLLLRPSLEERELFVRDHAVRPLGTEEEVELFKLLESQRMALYMFTSCGWFFDDISGLEATQVLKYGARARDLVMTWSGAGLEARLLDILKKAKSNDPAYVDGSQIYKELVTPSKIGPSQAAAHHALVFLMDERPPEDCSFQEIVRPVAARRLKGEDLYAVVVEAQVNEIGTGSKSMQTSMAFRTSHGDMSCLVGQSDPAVDMGGVAEELKSAVQEGAGRKLERLFCERMGTARRYELKDLLPDTRRCILEAIARSVIQEITDSIRAKQEALQEIQPLVEETGGSATETLKDIFRIMLSEELEKLIASNREGLSMDWAALRRLAKQAKSLTIVIDGKTVTRGAQDFLRCQMESIPSSPHQIPMTNVIDFLNLAGELKLELDLWECQNMFYEMYKDPKIPRTFDPDSLAQFHQLGQRLGFQVGG